jgi:hypothetical protein
MPRAKMLRAARIYCSQGHRAHPDGKLRQLHPLYIEAIYGVEAAEGSILQVVKMV